MIKRNSLEMYLGNLSSRDRDIISLKMQGERTGNIAKLYSITTTQVCAIVREYKRRKELAPIYDNDTYNLYHLNLKPLTYNALRRSGVSNIIELHQLLNNEVELKNFRYIGVNQLKEIKEKMDLDPFIKELNKER